MWIIRFDSSVLNPKAAGRFAAAWGKKGPDITDSAGRGHWEWADLDKLAVASRKDLPLFICLGYSWGPVTGYAKGQGRFYQAMQDARQPLTANWGWSGLRNRGNVNKYDGIWRGMRITRSMPIPAFSNSSRNGDRESTGNASGSFNWKGLTDADDRFAVTVISNEGTFDLTPRRMAKFKPAPGETLRWSAQAAPDPRSRGKEKGSPSTLQNEVE